MKRDSKGRFAKTRYIPWILGAGIVILGAVLYDDTQTYIAPEVKEKVVEVQPEWAKDQDAVEAAQAVIRKKELEEKEAQLVGEITAKQDELDNVRKELGTY